MANYTGSECAVSDPGEYKARLRLALLKERNCLDPEYLALAAQQCAQGLFAFLDKNQHITRILFYYPLGSELDLFGASMVYWGQQLWALPRINPGKRILFHYVTPDSHLERHRFGMKEPESLAPLVGPVGPETLVLVPSLGLGPRGHRIGYGGGYYDRWLSANPLALSLGVCMRIFMRDLGPSETHDVALKGHLCESGVSLVVSS